MSDRERCQGRDGHGWKAEPSNGAAGAGDRIKGTGRPRASVAATLATPSIPISGLGTGGKVHPLDLVTQACRGSGVEPLLFLPPGPGEDTLYTEQAGSEGAELRMSARALLLLRDSFEAGLQIPSLWCKTCSD